MKSIILHICCAPCAIFPVQYLRKQGFKVKGLFFNPNIHPFLEYKMRLEALKILSKDAEIEFEQAEYEPKIFFNEIHGQDEPPGRCSICWRMRLRETAKRASALGFEYFTTTLLVSPYQDTSTLEKIGEEEAKSAGIKFFTADFKSGFRQAHETAKKCGIYCQKYCGCLYSEIERSRKHKKNA